MRDKILIVDDVEINRELLAEILGDKYDILQAENGTQAMRLLKMHKDRIAVLMLDFVMPEMGGFEVLRKLNQCPWIKDVAIIIISSDHTIKTESTCFELGVTDFIHRPYDNQLVRKRVDNIVALFQYQQELENKVAEQTEALHRQYKMLQAQANRLLQSKENVIEFLCTIVEYRNLESGQHIERVKRYTEILARRMKKDYPEYGLDNGLVDIIVSASALHDIGKIAIPDSILLKPGKLTLDEFEYMKSHTTKGAQILKGIQNVWDDEYARVSCEICRHHHERYDALINDRTYKEPFPKDKAFQMILDGESGIFSPKLLECFKKVRREFEDMEDERKIIGGE